MDKRGQIFDTARKTIYWMIAAVVITAVLFAFAVSIANYKNKVTLVPEELQAELIALRFANVGECFALQDQATGKVSAGIIDFDKFTEERLNECYPLPSDISHTEYNFRLLLTDAGKEITTLDYANRDKFSFDKEVLVSNDGKLSKDRLIVYVQDLRVKLQ
ncbi:MAG: hypothetical protein KKA62_05655 [Nanoarchaeota archaeon]|nr:hypothetical protein [Nanoarchaeota archaeon]MBU1644696.1 hypothetical protein [Nanoarchaeota archaeon]MBU1977409.1 hypothetical protein [Nanoarchaeota archaeon]